MNPLIVFIIVATTTTLLATSFFILKYGGYVATTVPDWPIFTVLALINVGVALWFVSSFLTRDSLQPTEQMKSVESIEIPVKSAGYAPKLFRYHPFQLFSRGPLAEKTFAPVLSYKSMQAKIIATKAGLHITVLTQNFVTQNEIRQITIVKKNVGEMMTVELTNGSYYRIWLRLEDTYTKLLELDTALRDLGYPVQLKMDITFPSVYRNESDSLSKEQAREIAQTYITSLDGANNFVIIKDQTEAIALGWMFSYNSRAFARSKNIQDAIPGLGPLLVDKDGGTHQLPSLGPTQEIVQQVEQAFAIAQQRLRSEKPEQYQNYVLDEITLIDYSNGLWRIGYDVPNIDGAQVKMEIDITTTEVTEYRDSWS